MYVGLSRAVLAVLLTSVAACDGVGRFLEGGGAGNPGAAQAPAPVEAGHPAMTASSMVGRSEEDLTAALGRPVRVRNEPPAMVWHYDSSGCKLDVFFYFDIDNKDFRALAYKFYPPPQDETAERTCLTDIKNAKDARTR